MMVQESSKSNKNTKAQQQKVAVPVEVQIQLAETRRELAEARYEISVRKGRSWAVPPKSK